MMKTEIIADSIGVTNGCRLTTFVIEYPRYLHSELLTHRMFSRNSASSRAIPVNTLIQRVIDYKLFPIWGKNKKGMQSDSVLEDDDIETANRRWDDARNAAINFALLLNSVGAHKQHINRLIEPFAPMQTIITSSQWTNYYRLRAHKDALPEFQLLAKSMLKAHAESTPKAREPGDWHLPFGDRYFDNIPLEDKIKCCVARCARVSYLNFDGDINFQKDIELHNRLLESKHMSPFEHVAQCLPSATQSGNFVGWEQYRQMVEPRQTEVDIKLLAEQLL